MPDPQPEAFTDPVCGMTVTPERARGSLVHDGRTYYFCNPRCLEKFRAEPGRYLAPRPPRLDRRPRPRASTPARCTRRWCGRARGPARSAAWPWSP